MYLYKITSFTLLAVMGLLYVIVENNELRSFPGEPTSARNSKEMSQLEKNGRTRLETSLEVAYKAPDRNFGIITAPAQRAKQQWKLDLGARTQQRKQLNVATTSFQSHKSIPSPSTNSSFSPQPVCFNLVNESTVELLSQHKSLGIVERVDWPESSSDVYFSIKTTALNHKNRLMLLLATWLQSVNPSQVH